VIRAAIVAGDDLTIKEDGRMRVITGRPPVRIYLVLSISILIGVAAEPQGFPVLKGPYLGQEPPGMTPVVFAPGIISTDATEGASSFAHDHSFYLFARARSDQDGILITQQRDGSWSEPQLAAFSAGAHDWDFMLAPDGKTVFIASGRPASSQEASQQFHRIWVSSRTKNGWSTPRLLPPPVNTGQHDSYPSVTADGTLYFFSRRDGGLGLGDIYRSRASGGDFLEVENLGDAINTEHHEVDPYIAPDESYLIFCSDRPGGYGKDDFYITFRNADGSWIEPLNMGAKVNTAHHEYIPYVTPDGKYFFFTSNVDGDRDIYWVDAHIIEEFRANVAVPGSHIR
jgi:WD40-like Beta Propeller Repeat